MMIDFSAGTTADTAVIAYPAYEVEGLPLQPGDIREQDNISAPYATPGGSISASVDTPG